MGVAQLSQTSLIPDLKFHEKYHEKWHASCLLKTQREKGDLIYIYALSMYCIPI